MSDFVFNCPACGNGMSISDQYVGQQINCPTCQAPTVVPENPNAAPAGSPSISISGAPGQPPPPQVPKGTRLSVSGLSSPQSHAPAPSAPSAPTQPVEDQGSASYRAYLAKKPKKSYSGVITTVVAVVVIGGAAYLNRGFIQTKWKAWRGPTQEEIAATNKPVVIPELTGPEVMAQVFDLYKTMPNYTSAGKATAVLDESALSKALAAEGPKTYSADLKLKMDRPASYRVEMTIQTGTSNATAIGWSSGNGDWYQSRYTRTKMMSRDQVINIFAGLSDGVGGDFGDIIRLFMDDTSKGMAKDGVEWTRGKDDMTGGEPHYVLTASVDTHDVKIWVSRRTLLINQSQVVFDGSEADTMDDAAIKEQLQAENGKEPSLKQMADFKRSLKIKGTVTDTYGGIATNASFAANDFQPDAPAARPKPQPQQQPGGRATQIAGGAGGGRSGGGGGGRRR